MVIQIDLLLDLGWVWWTTTNSRIHTGSGRKVNFTPNVNSSVARRGSERVVGEGEGLSTT